MSTKRASFSVIATLIAGSALADVPKVAVDIAPVHSLVARVMQGVGAPRLILPPGASPHEYRLRPSEAKALQDADIVVWMGEDLAPWMDDAIKTLATDASVMVLLEAEETALLEFREGVLFEAHDDHDEHDEQGEEDHAEDEHDHDEHDEAQGHEGHGHDAVDPHAWLSASNARAWLNLIAAELSSADPENAGTYFANAAAAKAEMDALSQDVNAILNPVRGKSYVVFHDAYQYFETDFDFPASGAISISDASDPSPARIAEIQARVRDEGIACVLAEPQFNAGLVAVVLDGTEAKTGVIDPLGADLELGPTHYPQLIRNLAANLAGCL